MVTMAGQISIGFLISTDSCASNKVVESSARVTFKVGARVGATVVGYSDVGCEDTGWVEGLVDVGLAVPGCMDVG